MLCRMATDHGVAARFYLLVIVFCRSGIFFALASSTLTNAAIWPGGLWNGATFKFLETLGKAKRRLAARGDKLTNLCKKWPRAIPLLAWA